MNIRAIAMHDEALALAPAGARHDTDVCPICVDWTLTSDGTPSGFGRLDEAARTNPFGDVTYADPGLQSDGISRYPVDTEAHARTSWEFLEQDENASRYSPEQLAQVKATAFEALQRFGVKVDNASEDQVQEGGTKPEMDTIAQETHEALLAKAVQDATAQATAELASLREQVETLTGERDELAAELSTVKEDSARLNTELDTAQVALKAKEDEVASLQADIAERDDQARKAEVASQRAAQVRNLGLFPEAYITERASRWADVAEEDWSERIEEWKTAKETTGTTAEVSGGSTETSAFSGTAEGEATKSKSAKRAVLGLN